MKLREWFYILFAVGFLAGCQDELDEGGLGTGTAEGMVTLRFAVQDAVEIYTRADDNPAESAIENVMLAVVDDAGTVTNTAYFDALDGDGSVRLYLQSADTKIYAFCNLPTAVDEDGNVVSNSLRTQIQNAQTNADVVAGNITGEDYLKSLSLEITSADGAYPGSFVMSGVWEKDVATYDENNPIEVPVRRLAARLDFQIYFEPATEGDEFAITGIYMFNIPRGSKLLEHDITGEHDDYDVHTGDWVYDNETYTDDNETYTDRKKNYFNYRWNEHLDGTDVVERGDLSEVAQMGYRIDYEEKVDDKGKTYQAATFYQFENRQGQVFDNYDPVNNPTGDTNWDADLGSLKGQPATTGEGNNYPFDSYYDDLFEQYRQIKKREMALTFDRSTAVGSDMYSDASKAEGNNPGFPYASYMVIRGVYTKADGVGGGVTNGAEVMYFVYLGADNYRDFNIRRNHQYIYRVSIQSRDEFDTRVIQSGIDGIAVYYDEDEILDAHFNVSQALLYSNTEWKAYVKDPDATPWLEISTSPRYIPRRAGQAASDEQAQFSLSGGGGMRYIYIHTDEFIPKIANPGENPWYATVDYPLPGGDRTHMEVKTRKGYIVFESGTERQEITVEQYAAQMVICYIEHDVNNLMEEVRDTFYVERVMEKQNMPWGFDKYWCFVMDELISKGQWDGLKNTRDLYRVALQGDKMDIEAAYPDGIPSDIALGYALAKNRDRNGNGRIDPEEIVWYLPAANELQALYGHTRPFTPDYGNFYMDYRWAKTVYLPYEFGGPFHSSTPSAADPAGITPGFSYYVNLYNGEKEVGMRSRYYNVICARRHNAWRGDQTGTAGGGVGLDDAWDEEEEIVTPK